jgi:DNA-binding response OmpR family regulator
VARILIVEDELALRRVITLNLARRGYTVVEADSVITANEACAACLEPFDLILLDINLPDQTGWDVLRQLQEHGSSLPAGNTDGKLNRSIPPVIIVTAVWPQQSRIDEFQPAAVLQKPFPIAALLRLIERVLEHSPAEQSPDDDTGEAMETSEDTESHRPGA